ncbi:hypothetical protein [Sporosarcina sp. Marseille-Q4943]|uniref:hypothetical protein n=1 Tax=Sporosarcina sp. Marseille-Q4943 TaxID=2942204 RepID=UPI00208DD8D2|nr:hypothetical protein [Sporosarcina sp. Marseille-Q4943]
MHLNHSFLFILKSIVYILNRILLLIEAKGGDSCESRNEERLLRVKAKRYEHLFALAVTKNGFCE